MKSTSTFAILRCRSIFLIRPSIFFNGPDRIVITSLSDTDTCESCTSISLPGDSIICPSQSTSYCDSEINCSPSSKYSSSYPAYCYGIIIAKHFADRYASPPCPRLCEIQVPLLQRYPKSSPDK